MTMRKQTLYGAEITEDDTEKYAEHGRQQVPFKKSAERDAQVLNNRSRHR